FVERSLLLAIPQGPRTSSCRRRAELAPLLFAFHVMKPSKLGSTGVLPDDPLAEREMLAPPVAIEAVQAHGAAGARCMHEALPADVDADVGDAASIAEEYEIRAAQFVAIEFVRRQLAHLGRGARQRQVRGVAEHVADQAAAIESAEWRVAAEVVGRANQGDRTKQHRVGRTRAGAGRFGGTGS